MLDLSEKNLKKLEKRDGVGFHSLILDNNEICKLENLDRFPDLEKLSVCGNRLSRMYGVAKLHHLVNLDLSNNNIAWIEGLKELTQLSILNLSRNNIKCIQNLQNCINLTHIDLSKNIISALTDLSYLTKLQILNLDGNKITTLQNSSTYFPHSLGSLSLADNCITDLNEISYLYGLPCLEQLAIANNPAILMTGQLVGFDYRPFVVNWCLGIRLLDGYVVTQKESLKAEWLYSQGKGRHFQPGEHIELIEYLSQVCPLTAADQLVVEEEERLTRILRMQRQHREELLHEMSNSPKEQRKWNQQPPLQREQLQSSDEKNHLSPKLSSQERGESRMNVHNSSENGFLPDKLQKNDQTIINSELSQLENKMNSNKQERTVFATAKSPVTIEQIPTTEMLKTCFQSYEDRIIRPNHNIEMIKSVNSISGSYLTSVSNTTPVRKISVKRSNTHSPSSPATGRRPRTPRAQWKNRVSSSRGNSPQDTECRRTLHTRHNSESDTSEECGWSYKASGIQSPLRRKQLSEKSSRHSNCTSLRHSYSQTPINSDPTRSKASSSINSNVCNENRKNVNRILQSGSLIPSPCNSPIIGSRANRSPIKKSISDNVICVTQQQEKINAQKLKKMEKAVIKIQSTWRGYHARHYNPAVFGVRQEIRLRRMEDSIQFLHNIVLRQQEELQEEKELRKVQAADITKLHIQLEQIQESLEKIGEIKQQNIINKDKNLQTNLMHVVATKAGDNDDKSISCVLNDEEMLSNLNGPSITQQSDKLKNSLAPLTPVSPSHVSPIGSPLGEVKTPKSSTLVHCADICVPLASESDTDSGWQSMIGSFAGDGQSLENGFHIFENGKNDSLNTIPGGVPALCISQKITGPSSKLIHGITNEENLINSIRDSFLSSSSSSSLFQEQVSNCILLSNKNKLNSSSSSSNSSNNKNEDIGNKDGNSNKNSISIQEPMGQLKVPIENMTSDLSIKAVASDSLCSTPESSCTVIVQATKDEITCNTSHNDVKNENSPQKILSPERKTLKDLVNIEKTVITAKTSEILNMSHDAGVNVELLNSPSKLSKYRNNDTITDDEKTAELPRITQLKEYNSCMKNSTTSVESSLNINDLEKKNISSQEKTIPSRELSQQKVNSSSRTSLSSAATVWETRVHNIEATLQQLQSQFKELEGTIGQILTSPEGADISSEVE